MSITIKLVSIPVDHQEKALEFYTEKFGFEKRADMSQGDYWKLDVHSEAWRAMCPSPSKISSVRSARIPWSR